jgi:hypothetical protein
MRQRPAPQLFQSLQILTGLPEVLEMSMVISPECETFDILIAISFIDQVCPAAEWQNKAANVKTA